MCDFHTGRLAVLAALLMLPTLTGCSSRTQPVEGVVVFADTREPATTLAGYLVTFESVEHEPAVSATGVVQADGRFVMSTFAQKDGAVAGKQRVAITPPVDFNSGAVAPWLIHRRHGQFATSGLEIEVKPGRNDVKLEVQRPGRR